MELQVPAQSHQSHCCGLSWDGKLLKPSTDRPVTDADTLKCARSGGCGWWECGCTDRQDCSQCKPQGLTQLAPSGPAAKLHKQSWTGAQAQATEHHITGEQCFDCDGSSCCCCFRSQPTLWSSCHTKSYY